MNSSSRKKPSEEINNSNPWYIDNQIDIQLGSPASQAVVKNRWRIFEKALIDWGNENMKHKDLSRTVYILDAGCGDGINLLWLSQFVHKHSWSAHISGVDYNPLRIKRARQTGESVAVYKAALTELPFSDKSMDIVLCNQVIEHVPNDIKALKEIRRILRDDGIFILGVPNEGCLLAKMRNHFIEPFISRTTDHVNFYTAKIIIDKMKLAGFTIMKIEREGFFFPYFLIYSFLSEYYFGRKLFEFLQFIFPSQSAGLIMIAKLEENL